MSLRKQLTLILCGFALLPLLFFGAVDYSMSVSHLKATAMRELKAISDIQRERLLNQINQHKQRTLMIAQSPALTQAAYAAWQGTATTGELGAALDSALALAADVKEARIYGPKNTLLSRVAGTGYQLNILTEDTRHSELFLSYDNTGQPQLVDEVPVYHSGKFVGQLRLYSDARQLLRIFTDYSGMGDTGESILIRPDEHLRVKALHKRRYSDSGELTYNPFHAPFNSAHNEAYDVFDYRSEAVLLVGQFLPELKWGIIVKRDISEILGPAKAMLSRLNMFIMGIAALGIIVALRAAAIIHRPIARLTQTAKDIQSGNLGERADVSGHNEMAVLGRAINSMLDQLISDNTQLEKAVALRTGEAEAARKRAEENSRLQGEFLANMSHEVRTPLNGIMGIASILRRSVADNRTQEYLDIIESSGQNLLVIIDDILELSRANTGQLSLSEADFAPREVFRPLLKRSAQAANTKGLAFKSEFSIDFPDALHGDSARLVQVLNQLVSNAIKFTQHGDVGVHFDWEAHSPCRGTLCLRVKDTGIGINKTKQQHIFQPFVQVDGGSTRRYGGNGLGLSIAAHIVELMNGHIEVVSHENRGSTFIVSIELPVAESAPHISSGKQSSQNPRKIGNSAHADILSFKHANRHAHDHRNTNAESLQLIATPAKMHARGNAAAQAITLAAPEDSAPIGNQRPEENKSMILDEDRLRDITRNKPALITSISQLFIDELPDMRQSIESAYTQGERDDLAQSVHRMKSALGNFATQDYYNEVNTLETLARDANEPLYRWHDKWAKVTIKLLQLETELKDIAGL